MAPDASPVVPMPGTVIDGHRLAHPLHLGVRAQVWALEPHADGPALVIKLPCNDNDPATWVGFEVEQMILPLLAGPHVPRLVAQGDVDGRPYLVMERIEGGTLDARLGAAPWPVDDIAGIARGIAIALHDLHRQHVVHLDLTPGQVMFRAGGHAVLLGFGRSHHDHLPDLLADDVERAPLASTFLSPEQMHCIRNDARSDLFALGVLLYRLTTGQQPFGAPTNARGLRERLYRDPEPPRALRADCPAWLQEVILRCLEVDPDRRHQSAAQLAFDLQAPARIALSARAGRMTRRGTWPTMRRWFSTMGQETPALPGASEQAERHPIVLVALDVTQPDAALLDAQAGMVARLLQTAGDVRLACVAVTGIGAIGLDEPVDDTVNHSQAVLLSRLKHWARQLGRSSRSGRELRASFHVLEAIDAAGAIVDFASRHQVDQIVIGARRHDGPRGLGSVVGQVLTDARCSVTVVRHTLREKR